MKMKKTTFYRSQRHINSCLMETQFSFVLGFGMRSASTNPKVSLFLFINLRFGSACFGRKQRHLHNDNATKINVKNHVYVSVSHMVIICDRRISQTLQNGVAFKTIGTFFILFSSHVQCSQSKCIVQRMRMRILYILSALYSFEFCNRLRIPIRIKEKNCSTKCDIKTINVCV